MESASLKRSDYALVSVSIQPVQPYDAAIPPTLTKPRLRRGRHILEWLDLIITIGAIYALVNLTTVRFIVDGASMEPNFHTGEFIIVSRANYLFGEPERGDIAVFHFPGDETEDYIKRVIALPGDTIEFRTQQVYVNGELLYEPYINEPCSEAKCPDATYTMGPDDYFMMGDNRNHSSDSREFERNNRRVHREHIVGEAIIRYWPQNAWGIVNRIGYPEVP
jgi:signal peptidase I